MRKTVQTLQKDENVFHVLSTNPLPPIWTNLIIFVTPFFLNSLGLTVATDGLHEAHFAMARKEAVYFYSQDGRGQVGTELLGMI